jgi:prevent-host-death family protein
MTRSAASAVSIYEAKTHLSQLVTAVQQQGQEFTITRHDRPVARLVPFVAQPGPRRLGLLQGQIELPDGWDEFTAQDQRDWYGA